MGYLIRCLIPLSHRVHHGRNPSYIDKNYAGVLIVWDKLFGTYAKESQPVDYGITDPIDSHNPLAVTFTPWQRLFAGVKRAQGIKAKL